jgi:threonine dehydrogenase-like Zn-dependent dehydrogenase
MAVRNGGKLSIIGDYVGLADKITVSLDQVPKMYDLWNKKEEGAIKVTWKP